MSKFSRAEQNIEAALLALLEKGGRPLRFSDAWASVGRALDRAIPRDAFDGAVAELAKLGRLKILQSGAETKLSLPGREASAVEEIAEKERAEIAPSDTANGLVAEADLMASVKAWIREAYCAQPGFSIAGATILRNTSRARAGYGPWSLPDFAAARLRSYEFTTLRHIDLYSFELKRADSATIIAVHEALAHTRFVHFSYLVAHAPPGSVNAQNMGDIRTHCALHGIGLITFESPSVIGSYQTHVEPTRKAPDPAEVDEFILSSFRANEIATLRDAVRAP